MFVDVDEGGKFKFKFKFVVALLDFLMGILEGEEEEEELKG